MELTDSELLMIEQLCYLNAKVGEKAGLSSFNGIESAGSNNTVGSILEVFSEAHLTQLEAYTDEIAGAFASGEEWVDIIRYLKNSELSKLVLSDIMLDVDGKPVALCLSEPGNDEEAIVAFIGTMNETEWRDNAQGINASDTTCQMDALEFVEDISYDNITVVGHSKGGNKAMYVAILSDKVQRCVSFDGQGFSEEFLEKYWAEINLRGERITNYSLSTDYVHTLLFPIPNSIQNYCEGYGIDNVKQHHSPNSFFVTDESGNIVMDENGNPRMNLVTENSSMQILHDFSNFLLNNAGKEDKKQICNFLEGFLSLAFTGSGASVDELIDYALSRPEQLAILVAYLAKYMEVNDVSTKDIDILLNTLGLKSLDEMRSFGRMGLSDLINYAKQHLNDDNDDFWVKNVILPFVKWLYFDEYNIDIGDLWKKMNNIAQRIDVSDGCEDLGVKNGEIYDYSINAYQSIMDTIANVEKTIFYPTSTWKNYETEEWYSELGISDLSETLNQCITSVGEMNQVFKGMADTAFDNMTQVDIQMSEKFRTCCQNINNIQIKISHMAAGLKGY